MNFLFGIYPYICLSILILGLIMRAYTAQYTWNSRSTEIFEKRWLRLGSMFFHYGIIFSLGGHIIGLLTPEWIMHSLGVSTATHTLVAVDAGMIIAPAVVFGVLILGIRHFANAKVFANTSYMDIAILCFILINASTGMYQAYVAHFPVFSTIGPWIRSVLTFQPDINFLTSVPLFMKVHILSACTLFALLPFSRLVHILALPLTYLFRPLLVYRRRYAGF